MYDDWFNHNRRKTKTIRLEGPTKTITSSANADYSDLHMKKWRFLISRVCIDPYSANYGGGRVESAKTKHGTGDIVRRGPLIKPVVLLAISEVCIVL